MDITTKIEHGLRIVCEYMNANVELIKSKSRKRELVRVRQMSMAANYKALHGEHDRSLKIIGKIHGGRDHSTVIHSLESIDNYIFTEKNNGRTSKTEFNLQILVAALKEEFEMLEKMEAEALQKKSVSLTNFHVTEMRANRLFTFAEI